jgi:hypothetical protein
MWTVRKKVFFSILAFVLLGVNGLFGQAETRKVVVIKAGTIIHEEASFESPVVTEVGKGTILDSLGMEAGWHRVFLRVGSQGKVLSGFVSQKNVAQENIASEENEEIEEKPRAYSSSSPKGKYLSLASGIGIPFGVIGVNAELNPVLPGAEKLGNYMGITFGLGYCYPGLGFAGGLRFYPVGREKMICPKLTAYLGTVGFVSNYGDSVLYGGTLGTGALWNINKKSALDFELLFMVFLFGWDMDSVHNGRIKIALGYRHFL